MTAAPLRDMAKPAPRSADAPDGAPDVWVPVRTKNPLNNRSGWRGVAAIARRVRGTTVLICRRRITTTLPAVVTLTRYSPGEMDDDNLAATLKPVRDGVADVFGTNDSRKSGLTFRYAQAKSKEHGVRIEVVPAPRRDAAAAEGNR